MMDDFTYSPKYIEFLQTVKYKDVFNEMPKYFEIDWLVCLSTRENKKFFLLFFKKIITNIDELHRFVEVCRKSNLRKGLGRCEKRAVNTWLHDNLSKQENLDKNKLIDIIRITRPCFKHDAEFQKYISNILKNN